MQISQFFAEIGFKVNTEGLKDFQQQMKALTSAFKANIEDSKAAAAASKAQEAAEKAKTAAIRGQEAEIRKNLAAHRLQVAETKEAERQARLQEKEERQRLKRRQQAYQEFARTVRNTILGVSGAVYGIIKFTQATRERALEYRDFQRQTGLSVEGLQQYQAAAQITGSQMTGTDVTRDITNLQQRLVDVEFGQGDLFPYKMLGISAATKDAMAVIEALRRSIQGLDDARALNLIERMGLSADWLHILRQSREEFERIRATMLSKEQVSGMTQLALTFRRIGFSLSNLKDQMTAFVGGILSTFIDNFRYMVDIFSAWIKSLYESPNAIRAFSAAVGMLIAAISPLSATLLGLYLLLEDMIVASRGGKSFFGWDMEGAKNAFRDLKSSLQSLWEGVELFFKVLRAFLGALYDTGEAIGEMFFKIQRIIERIVDLVVSLYKAPQNIEKSITNAMQGKSTTAGQSGTDVLFNPAAWGQGVEDLFTSLLRSWDPAGRYNNTNNNIVVHVGSPEEASRFVTDISNNQSNIDTTYVTAASVGGGG